MSKVCAYHLNSSLCRELESEGINVSSCLNLYNAAYEFERGEVSLFAGDFTELNEEEAVVSICRLRDKSNAPIIIIADICSCRKIIEAGADLCFPPEIGNYLLVSHIIALSRRCKIYNIDLRTEPALVHGCLRLDPLRHRVWLNREELSLQRREFRLLSYFVRNPGIVLTPETICETVWMSESDYHRDVSSVISQLRKKLGDDPKRPTFIETVHGVGYRFLGTT